MRAFVISLSFIAILAATALWLSKRPSPLAPAVASVKSPPAPMPVSPPEPTTEEETPEPPPPPHAPAPSSEISVTPDSQARLDTAPAPTRVKREKDPPADDPETTELIERLHKLQSDPAAQEQFYKELEDSFDTIHNQQAVPVSKPPDVGQPQANLTTYDNIFDSVTAQPVTFTRPEIREETLPLAVPVPPLASPPAGSNTNVRDLVVYWAKKNNVPAELALAVAYQESRFALNPPRGSAGEVGPMQIMPERCRAEGYPPSRLWDPQFNIWLGTKLLAKYFAEEKSYARAASKYVAGPAVFERLYSREVQNYINAYAASVERNAHYFAEHS